MLRSAVDPSFEDFNMNNTKSKIIQRCNLG